MVSKWQNSCAIIVINCESNLLILYLLVVVLLLLLCDYYSCGFFINFKVYDVHKYLFLCYIMFGEIPSLSSCLNLKIFFQCVTQFSFIIKQYYKLKIIFGFQRI